MVCSFKIRCPCTIFPSQNTFTSLSSISYSVFYPRVYKTKKLVVSSSASQEAQALVKPSAYNVRFVTMEGCKLGISRYPNFEYNALGGSGSGNGSDLDDPNGGMVSVSFDVGTLYIPPLMSGTTKFLGLPLPPFLRIDIVPEILQGNVHKESGKVDLAFKANFWFSIGTIYKAPPLLVTTNLTSEEAEGRIRRGRGQRMDKNGKCKLVGIASVDPINDIFMDTFLSLPTECLAILNATISIE